MGIPDRLTCLLRNLYTGQEAIVRTGHGTTDWFQIGKGKDKVSIGAWIYLWAFCFFPLIYISVFVPVPYALLVGM